MSNTLTLTCVGFLVATMWGLSVEAQTTGRTSTRQTNPAFGASATRTTGATTQSSSTNTGATIGGGIAQGVQSFSAGVPALQQSQQLRDTSARGQFVGAEARDAQQAFGAAQATTNQQRGAGLNVRTGTFRQPGTQARRTSAYGRQAGTTLQPTLTLGFSPALPSAANVQRSVTEAIMRVPSIRDDASIAVHVQGGVVTLEGTVTSAHQRALASQLVALEPGVAKIDNRLTVSPGYGRAQ
ncbi:MAG: BON domain-containing protein [Thermoguttaceae bacterium]|nr:BON domain-containing protein [Thermoguttaceae bacterium]